MRRGAASAGLALALLAGAASAQPATSAPKLPDAGPVEQILRLSGGWKIETEDGKHSCRLILSATRIPAGYVVTQPTPCADPRLWMDEVVAWRINPESLQFTTVTGSAVSTFFPGPNGELATRTDEVLKLTSTDKDGEGTL